MSKEKITVSLSDDTIFRLDFLCKKLGLRRSQAIAFAINSFVLEKHPECDEDLKKKSSKK